MLASANLCQITQLLRGSLQCDLISATFVAFMFRATFAIWLDPSFVVYPNQLDQLLHANFISCSISSCISFRSFSDMLLHIL